MEKEHYCTLINAPKSQPVSFSTTSGKLFLNKDEESDDSVINLSTPNAICNGRGVREIETPEWVGHFFERMDDYSKTATKAVSISKDGQLSIEANATPKDLKQITSHLAWLFESQSRQNKEILVWIGEIILDYMARASHSPSIEEAVDDLGFLERDNGVKWKMKTLVKWVVVAQRIPHEIRQLPVPQSYLAEAALFARPEDPEKRVKFDNIRDAMLLSVAENPDEWSRNSFVACIKELQHEFDVTPTRNEGISSLQTRLIQLYRLQREVENGYTTYAKLGLDVGEISAWIYNMEFELQYRHKMNPDPTQEIPKGDGLTQAARERIIKKSEAITKNDNTGNK
jgi:hypothetical protein